MKLSTITIESILGRGKNNFDLIRLVAALAVIFAHSYELFPKDINIARLGNAGTWAVNIFFFLSGIFITASFNNSTSKLRFVVMRVSRIWPALIVCLFLTAFVLGPIVTTLDAATYLAHPETMSYFLTNLYLSDISFILPGVFKSTHYPSVNGSLWTLAPEVRCYLFVFIAGLLGMLSSRRSINLTCLFVVLIALYYPEFVPYFRGKNFIRVGGCFLIGMFAYANRDLIRLDWKLAIGLFAVYAIFRKTSYGDVIFYVAVMYLVLVIAAFKPLERIKLAGDYSYGVYIYGFVVQETVNYSFPHLRSTPSMLITMPVTLIFAIISWNLIEKPSLALGRSLANSTDAIKDRTTIMWSMFSKYGKLITSDTQPQCLQKCLPPVEEQSTEKLSIGERS